VHATIAGVIMGLATPARPPQTELEAEEILDVLEHEPDLRTEDIRATATAIKGSVSACDRLIDVLHPWTSYVIVPIFALANAGIELSTGALSEPSAVLSGVAVGLVAGKLVGIVGFSWLAVRLGFGRLPHGARWGHVAGVGALAGIGFTVSLFITDLAFDTVALQESAKIGILIASIIAAAAGGAIFTIVARSTRHRVVK
jgi:NhaA family Na+:H+ antiporter